MDIKQLVKACTAAVVVWLEAFAVLGGDQTPIRCSYSGQWVEKEVYELLLQWHVVGYPILWPEEEVRTRQVELSKVPEAVLTQAEEWLQRMIQKEWLPQNLHQQWIAVHVRIPPRILSLPPDQKSLQEWDASWLLMRYEIEGHCVQIIETGDFIGLLVRFPKPLETPLDKANIRNWLGKFLNLKEEWVKDYRFTESGQATTKKGHKVHWGVAQGPPFDQRLFTPGWWERISFATDGGFFYCGLRETLGGEPLQARPSSPESKPPPPPPRF